MKKAYITPSTLVVKTELHSMVCVSVDVKCDTSYTTDGQDALGRRGGSLWDDDEDEY